MRVTESAFPSGCMKSVLVKIQVLAMSGSDGVCGGTCFYLHAVEPGLYHTHIQSVAM